MIPDGDPRAKGRSLEGRWGRLMKIVKLRRERTLRGIAYCEPHDTEGATVRLTKAFVERHFRGRRPSEIVVIAAPEEKPKKLKG